MNHTTRLAWIKLRETRRQRDRLQKQYDAIEARVARAGSPLERLRALYQGLREVTFAQRALHPDVRELDALYLADELGEVPPELIADRTRFLERELAQGRMRAEFTYAFGRILSEWTEREPAEADAHEPSSDPFAEMWQEPPPLDHAGLERAFAGLRDVLPPIAEKVEQFARSGALAPFKNDEVVSVLRHLARNAYLAPALRRQAAEAVNSATQVTELAGVSTILLNSLDEWDWPEEPELRAEWVRVKFRPYLDADLITALFLQLVGMRWADKLKPLLVWQNLRAGKERLFRPEPRTAPTSAVAGARLRQQADRFLASLPGDDGADGGAGYNAYALLDLFLGVEREIRFARALNPGRPLFVVQADLRDYYPSLSHELVLGVLRQLGVPQRWRTFFGKFLAPRVRYRGQARQLGRGLPLDHALADLFGELVLWVLDLHVYRATGTQLLRMVDDLWFLADSREHAEGVWREVLGFCRACGLAVNESKSGSVCLGGPSEQLPEGLPEGRPRWGLLRLRPDETWEVDEPALAQLEESLRREAKAARSVLSLVARYNGYLHYVLGQLAPSVVLRGNHLRAVGHRLNHMHENLFGPGHGLVEEVGRRLRDGLADDRLRERGLPHALVYWPITAGGLALAHPLLHVASYLRGGKGWTAPRPPEREVVSAYLWRRKEDAREVVLNGTELEGLATLNLDAERSYLTRTQLEEYRRARERGTDPALPAAEEVDVAMASAWAWFYNRAVGTSEPSGPPELAAMERLVKDFVERGGEVSGRRQSSLSPYWRWVVYTYGPSLLEALGTFRFLLTELVPLQLILANRGVAAGADDGGGPAPAVGSDEFPF